MKLLTVGSNVIHLKNYHNLIREDVSDILFITDRINEKFAYDKIKLVPFSIKNPFQIKKSINKIKQIIQNYNPDIIHIHQAGTNAYLALKASKKFKIPTIVTAWGGDILDVPDYNFLYKKLTKYVLKNAGYFTSDSLFMASKMQHLAFPDILDITIANFGINIEKKDLPKENIIFSNRLHKKMYRIDKIIESFKRFITDRKQENWKLVIAGEGDETSKLKQLTTELEIDDKVEFVGWLDKASNNEYYFRSKIFISIPTSDATSISLLEAMAAGCIPVLSNLPANLEWVIDGLNGVIVDNLNNNFIERALELDYNKVKDINSYIIEKKATKEVNRKKFIDLYNRVLGNI
jgi:glycosyltransferase involved in cell wall biosynthesis